MVVKDEQLIELYRSGDEAAFEALVVRYMDHIYRFVYGYCRSESEAQDLTQEVFVRVWKNLKRFDQERYFKVWLFTIAKNVSLDWLKKKRPSLISEFENEHGENVILETLADTAKLQDEAFDESLYREFISSGIRKLCHPYRQVVELRFEKSLTFSEIAGLLGTSLDTIKSHYRRGVVRLQKILLQS